ncbi:CBO0543 family protein [Halalkalibacter akibai]|uniref:Uncharacterized protein n=1 Tax=Halalkalibacter akibai (strain ATCC 43226 / DSM 21942 / CIP 109018 / JCM 9157 / 1139) TaxID=1236973 RepID=W4QYF4_HALA3|nr:CBO0543 family protein [Halalkalibacter akibai]GAE36698.1 hypothetical protein JCM9157_3911 [Halalkalibacter akibai JCM 9157]
MKEKGEYFFLVITTITGLTLLPFAIFKRLFKDWIIVYLVSATENFLTDEYLTSRGFLSYNKKLFPWLKGHLPFDLILFPLLILYYNQWTLNNKPVGAFLKLFPFAIPLILIEAVAEKKTNLISWKKGWSWYHSLLCRTFIAFIKMINNRRGS